MDGRRDDAIGLLPRPALLQHSLAHPADKKRLKQQRVCLVEKQVAVELSIGRQGDVKNQSQDSLRLVHLPECIGDAPGGFELGPQHLAEKPPRRFLLGPRSIDPTE